MHLYNSDLLQDAKMKRHKAERHWLTFGLTVHEEIYVASKKTVTNIIHDAKLAYFSSKIADCTNCKQLFMSLINSWEDINRHLFLPQFLVFLTNFLRTSIIK